MKPSITEKRHRQALRRHVINSNLGRRGGAGRLLGAGAALMFAAGVYVPGCGSGPGAELCDLECECAPCNDRERSECEINNNAAFDVAEAYDCASEYQD
ncbi:MAG: hypothetical protein AAGN82_28675, partial [Myxococcota bacterium]